jgi:hypothetical protein
MTEPDETPPPDPSPLPPVAPARLAPAQAALPAPARPPRRRRLLPWLVALGFLVLAGAQAALWYVVLGPLPWFGPPGQLSQALDTRLAQLEQRPAPPAPDLGPLTARVAALEQKPQAGVPDQRLQAIEARIAHLEQRPTASPPNLAPLEARVAALEQRPASATQGQPAPATPTQATPTQATPAQATPTPATDASAAPKPYDFGSLEARVAALEQRPTGPAPETAPASSAPASATAPAPAPASAPTPATPTPATPTLATAGADDGLAQRLAAAEARITSLEKAEHAPGLLADRANRIARVQAALAALAVGQPIGDLQGAPPALARYATTAPPTEAALRLAFPAAAQAAITAEHPSPIGKPVLERIWAEMQDLVTIRQGDHVLIGDPSAGVLARAQTALDAGDLAGAATSVATLSGPAAQAMATWLDQARALLAARAALSDLATHT